MQYLFKLGPPATEHEATRKKDEASQPSVRGREVISKKHFERIGCAVFRTETRHGLIKAPKGDRVYLVLEGEGQYTVGGETFDVTKGDVILVPRDTPYDYKGRLTVFLVDSPADSWVSDISLEEIPSVELPPERPERIL